MGDSADLLRVAERDLAPRRARPELVEDRAFGRGVMVVCALVAVGFTGLLIELGWRGYHEMPVARAIQQAVGALFVGVGLVAWWRQPGNRTGPLIVVAGLSWYASNLQYVHSQILYGVGYWLAYVDVSLFTHVAVAYPEGRVSGRPERVLLVVAYGSYLVLQGIRYLVEGDQGPIGWQPSPASGWGDAVSIDTIMFTFGACWIIVRHWRRTSRPARRIHAPVWALLLINFALVIVACALSVLHLGALSRVAVVGLGLTMVVLPFAFLSGLLRANLARRRVADLVVELQHAVDPARLRDLLVNALGEPTLVLGFWSPEGGYVDGEGRPVTLPEPHDTGRVATFVEEDGQRLAVLVHDRDMFGHASLLRAVVAAARLALSNARLQAVLVTQIAELRASRARIAQVALDERRRIERDLHDGVQQRLLRLTWLAKQTQSTATDGTGSRVTQLANQLTDEARRAHHELSALARGIHPSIVTEKGLAIAVEEYALDAPFLMNIDLPRERLPDTVEIAAYFGVMEAVVNAAKHAEATEVWVRGSRQPDRLLIDVVDDGAGGANPDQGTGLRGLRDRVAALGGTLTIDSEPGRGTRIHLELPCD